jgi:hypothetical protein
MKKRNSNSRRSLSNGEMKLGPNFLICNLIMLRQQQVAIEWINCNEKGLLSMHTACVASKQPDIYLTAKKERSTIYKLSSPHLHQQRRFHF